MLKMLETLKQHWPEYLMEALGLGLFMISACAFGVVLEHPGSMVHKAIPDGNLRRVLMGLAMGLTAIGNVYSPWGKRSGAHLNPSLTLAFFRLGNVKRHDALFYAVAQFIGAITGVVIASAALGSLVAHPSVNYVATLPGESGVLIAFAAEVFISFILVCVVLRVSSAERLARYTGLFAGALVASYISIEAPLSGMSMNPARTFGSAFSAANWTALWIYFTAPPAGMLLAAEVYVRTRGREKIACAKLHHQNSKRCIFCGKAEGTRLAAKSAGVCPVEGNY